MQTTNTQSQTSVAELTIQDLEKEFALFDEKLTQLEVQWAEHNHMLSKTFVSAELDIDTLEKEVKEFEEKDGADAERSVLELINSKTA